LQAVAGLAVLAGALAAFQQLTEDRQQAGADRELTRQVLAAYLRRRTPQPPKRTTNKLGTAPLEFRAPDIHAALTVLGRRQPTSDDHGLNLRALDPSHAFLPPGPNLSKANLTGTWLNSSPLLGADRSDAALSKANLSGPFLEDANLTGADLNLANLSGAGLQRSEMSGNDIAQADLSEASLEGANLSRADLYEADLSRADLSGANLSGASLINANLTNADFTDADLTNADLTGVDLNSTDFSKVKPSRP
jgi:uncharacterized protein YjbI with pentapeptide repeats